jgi:hypothetical protein
MRLHFDRAGVERLLAHTLAATEHNPTFGETKPKAALWLVGDDGVYLMSNGKPGLPHEDGSHVVYAREVNPKLLPFEQWWEAKQRSYGGDDGCDALPARSIATALATYPPGAPLILDVMPNGTYAVISYVSAPPKKPARKPTTR